MRFENFHQKQVQFCISDYTRRGHARRVSGHSEAVFDISTFARCFQLHNCTRNQSQSLIKCTTRQYSKLQQIFLTTNPEISSSKHCFKVLFLWFQQELMSSDWKCVIFTIYFQLMLNLMRTKMCSSEFDLNLL